MSDALEIFVLLNLITWIVGPSIGCLFIGDGNPLLMGYWDYWRRGNIIVWATLATLAAIACLST